MTDKANATLNKDEKIEELIDQLSAIRHRKDKITNAADFHALEIEVHNVSKELADTISGIKLQEHLSSTENKETEKELVKAQPKKNEKHGGADS
tara:strand:- start:1150 stop:1431 length:282 start_codon:yes stop_codon:yes gene_type:complete